MERHDAREMLAALLPRLRRLAAALSGSLGGGDELVAATVRRTLDALDQWPSGMRFDSWVFRVLHGLASAPERRAKRGEGMDWKPDERMVLHNARVAVAGLPEMQRLVMALVDVEGLNYGEAAKTLEIPLSDLAVYLARARAGVATALDLGLGERQQEEGKAGFPDDLLIAAADGELTQARQAEITARLEAEPELEKRSRVLQEAGNLAEEAFQDILQEDLPPWLEAELHDGRAEARLEPPAPRRPALAAQRPGRRTTALIAAAAVLLVIGVVAVAGPRLNGKGEDGLNASSIAASPKGASLANPIAAALNRKASEVDHRIRGGRLRIFMSFRDGEGRYCRYYEAAEAMSARGVIGIACRGGDRWLNVLALPAEGKNLESLRPESRGMERLEAALDRLMQDEALAVEEERRLIRTGWPETAD